MASRHSIAEVQIFRHRGNDRTLFCVQLLVV